MDKQEFLREEFSALRREIDATKTRLFRTLALALVVVPAVTYFASKPEAFILGLIVPFLVLVFTMLFVAEEHALMRCGRYVRERIEAKVADGAGWEGWLEAQPHLRAMDKYLLACFVITDRKSVV